ncbi:MAG: RidA family protein [Saprospiraceae bacterium]|nr:RidA family protein [Saprospiraceae bacterium]
MDRPEYKNPFATSDPDRKQIWEMLVERDIVAFCAADWAMVEHDFIKENFMGIDARGKHNPDSWALTFPDLQFYQAEWLKQARDFAATEWSVDAEQAILDATTLRDIEIKGDSALAHKKFDGILRKKNGEQAVLNWQTLYRCRKIDDNWKIVGFTGYMPHPMGGISTSMVAGKSVPEGASQHKTAGPYSPVLTISPGQLVVISGQAALNKAGDVVGDTIEEQTQQTLANCQHQLLSAGVDLRDVFKVNVYLTDLDNWPRFNEVYKTYFTEPLPVRTAVQTPLLMTLLVEIEMWAVKK